MRPERNLVQIPVALVILVVERVDEIVDVRELHELAQRVADEPAALDFADVAVVVEVHFPPREEAGVIGRAGDLTVNDRQRLARQPFLLERRIIDDRIPEPPGRLIRKHVQVSTLIDAARPVHGLLLADVGPDIGAFRILGRELVDVHERLHELIFGELPHVAGIRAERAHDIPSIVDEKQAQELVFHGMKIAAQERAAALAPEDPAHLRMLRQIRLNPLPEARQHATSAAPRASCGDRSRLFGNSLS